MLVLSLTMGLTLSGTYKATNETLIAIEKAMVKVCDALGITNIGSTGDLLPDDQGIYNLGYYTFQGEVIPVWLYIEDNIPSTFYTDLEVHINTVNTNVYDLWDTELQETYEVFKVSFNGSAFGIYPIVGSMYFDLHGGKRAWFSMTTFTGVKAVMMEKGWATELQLIVPDIVHGATVTRTETTLAEWVKMNID